MIVWQALPESNETEAMVSNKCKPAKSFLVGNTKEVMFY